MQTRAIYQVFYRVLIALKLFHVEILMNNKCHPHDQLRNMTPSRDLCKGLVPKAQVGSSHNFLRSLGGLSIQTHKPKRKCIHSKCRALTLFSGLSGLGCVHWNSYKEGEASIPHVLIQLILLTDRMELRKLYDDGYCSSLHFPFQ